MIISSYQQTAIQYRLSFLVEHCIVAVAFFLPLSLDITSIFLALAAVLWVGRMVINGRLDLKRTPFDTAIAILVALSATSILFAPERWLSFYNYYHLMGRYIVLYYLVVNNVHSVDQLKRLVSAVFFSASIVAAYGFYQYLHGVDISAFEWVDGEQFPDLKVRVFSTLQNPNLLAGFLVVIIAVASSLGFNARRPRRKLLFLGLVLALVMCLALTYSRGAWLSIVAVIVAFGVLYSRKTFWLLLLVPVVVVAGHDVLMERLMSIFHPTDTSSTLRLALWESSIAMIVDHPLFGIGWGAYEFVYPAYDFFVLDAGTKIFHAHNMYLHIAAEIGLPGLVAFLIIMYGHARLALELAANTANRWLHGLMLGVLVALLSIAVSGFTDYIMFNPQVAMLYWLLNAMIMAAVLADYPTKTNVKC